jgi:hypothetical protein
MVWNFLEFWNSKVEVLILQNMGFGTIFGARFHWFCHVRLARNLCPSSLSSLLTDSLTHTLTRVRIIYYFYLYL